MRIKYYLLLLLLALSALTAFAIRPLKPSFADNADCTLRVPNNPLSAQGLASVYVLHHCKEANPNQSVFVQGAIIDPATGAISIYNPLVSEQEPAIMPTPPHLPDGAVIAVWGGGNDNVTRLTGPGAQSCVNGLDGSPFGQFWYCGAQQFFAAAHRAIAQGKLTIPPIGKGIDGQPCPTVRSFTVVDQDQSDNVNTSYLVTADGRTAQNTAANRASLTASILVNPSDNLVVTLIGKAEGCHPWMAPDLADNNNLVAALPLNELQAEATQEPPVALVPLGDPMTQVEGDPSLRKVNLYRTGVDQPLAQNRGDASTKEYCVLLHDIGPTRLALDSAQTLQAASPAAAVGNNLFTFLGARYVAAYQILRCQKLIGKPDRVQVVTDDNGVTIAVIIDGTRIPA